MKILLAFFLAATARAANIPARGIISGFDVKRQRVAVLTGAGDTLILKIRKSTRILLDDGKSKLDELSAGLKVSALYDNKTFVASFLDAHNQAEAVSNTQPQGGSPTVTGEVANTDVIAGKISLRLKGGNMLDLAVGEKTKVWRETPDKPAVEITFEAVNVGDRAGVLTRDWSVADEIRVRAPQNQ